jgi:phosphoribosylanthranilate isomerase
MQSLCQALSVDMVQLHGETSLKHIQLLRRIAPNLRIIKSLIVRGNNIGTLVDEVAVRLVERRERHRLRGGCYG